LIFDIYILNKYIGPVVWRHILPASQPCQDPDLSVAGVMEGSAHPPTRIHFIRPILLLPYLLFVWQLKERFLADYAYLSLTSYRQDLH